jgi:hypothetical protein
MIRNLVNGVVVAAFLLVPACLMAGGPPMLCLPIDGVTSANVEACTRLLNAKLGDKVWPHASRLQGVKVMQKSNQWYLAFYMEKDVRLSELNAALSGSEFSIPKDRLQLFGHVVLEIQSPEESRPTILTALTGIPHVAVEESKTQGDLLSATIDMPYPIDKAREEMESLDWDKFQRNDLNSTPSTQPRIPVTRQQLPGYDKIREVVMKHEASLNDIRWSNQYVCRAAGGVAEPKRAGLSKQ